MLELPVAVTEEERRRYTAEGLWSADETLASLLLRNEREVPEREALVDASGRRLTYAELADAARALAAALAARGIGPGDIVPVQLPNRVEASIASCAIDLLGAVAFPLVTMFRERELEYVAQLSRAPAMIVPGMYRRVDHDAIALAVQRSVPSLRHLITLTPGPGPGLVGFDALLEEGRGSALAPPPTDPDAAAAVLLTSGTEARPKAVVHTNNTLLSNCRAAARMLDMGRDDGIFMASPVGHGTGFGFGIRFAVHLGSKLVLQDVWDPKRAVELLAAEGSAYMHASTTFAQDLLELGETDPGAIALRYFVSGGATIPSGFVSRVREQLGCTLLRLYGQTEAFMTTLNRPEDGLDKLDHRDGRAVPGVEIAVRGEDGTDLPPGVTGEFACRGPHRCQGFLADAERTAAAIDADGWLRMGDLGTIDADGYITVEGRAKEVISRGGYKFSPREIEDLLLEHPLVGRIALVKVPDDRLGERACACVIPVAGDREPTLEALVAFLRERGVAPYKLPERLEVMDAFPTTPSGKVQKVALERELASR